MILRALGWIVCWFVTVCLLELLHGVAIAFDLLPDPGKGVWGPLDWVLVVISVPLVIALYQALPRRRRKKSDEAVYSAGAAKTINEAFAAYGRGDYATALRLLRPLADKGNANAQYNLGNMYMDGQGVPQNDAEAVKWFRRAADQGFIDAQSNLGGMYMDGRGVPLNHAEALKWLRLAAHQGDPEAQANLGNMYIKGNGVQQSIAEAMKWWRRAADQGLAIAQFNVGFGYASGQGVPQDDAMAHMWFKLSAAQGSHDAATNLDTIEQIMTPAQIAEAQKLEREWKPKSERPLLAQSRHP
jgi:TPR repeat protein